jgi:hypothetical protein
LGNRLQDTESWPIVQWYSKADAHCETGTGTCWVTLVKALASGDCIWYVQAWNYSGLGDWNSMTFSTLGKATLISPTGSISTSEPTYKWDAVCNAEYYLLAVRDATGSWPDYNW